MVVEHKAVFAVELEVAQPGVLDLVAASVPDVADLQASVDTLVVLVAAYIPGVADLQASVDVPVVFVAAYIPGVAELQASADILVVFAFLFPASLDAVEVDRPGCPSYCAVPNVDHYANFSSCAEVVD